MTFLRHIQFHEKLEKFEKIHTFKRALDLFSWKNFGQHF